jgi:hypothetical protein
MLGTLTQHTLPVEQVIRPVCCGAQVSCTCLLGTAARLAARHMLTCSMAITPGAAWATPQLTYGAHVAGLVIYETTHNGTAG